MLMKNSTTGQLKEESNSIPERKNSDLEYFEKIFLLNTIYQTYQNNLYIYNSFTIVEKLLSRINDELHLRDYTYLLLSH